MQGIVLILLSILLTMFFGNYPFFDFSFLWSVIFDVVGIIGCAMSFLPGKKE